MYLSAIAQHKKEPRYKRPAKPCVILSSKPFAFAEAKVEITSKKIAASSQIAPTASFENIDLITVKLIKYLEMNSYF